MADITMCPGYGCPQKETCYRYTATQSEWQSWSDYYQHPYVELGECAWYWPLDEDEKRETTPTKSREA